MAANRLERLVPVLRKVQIGAIGEGEPHSLARRERLVEGLRRRDLRRRGLRRRSLRRPGPRRVLTWGSEQRSEDKIQ